MGKLKRILLEEVTTLVPFGFLSKRINKYWTNARDSKCDSTFRLFRRVGLNALISVGIPYCAIVTLGLGANPLSPQNFFRDVERKKVRMEQEAREYSKERFYEVDENGDFVLDPNEFYNCTHGGRE